MNPSVIIDALGGTFRVAELCEVRPPSVSDWKKHGIPRARMMFLRVARPDVFLALEAGHDKAFIPPAEISNHLSPNHSNCKEPLPHVRQPQSPA